MLIKASQSEHQPPPSKSYRSAEELKMRDALEQWIRVRWPEARIVHELVVGRGEARADVVAVCPKTFISFEIKSGYDSTSRLMHQICMFRLVSPMLWIGTVDRHLEDVELVQYLIPSLGLLCFPSKVSGFGDDLAGAATVKNEAQAFKPHPVALLNVLWVAELHAEAVRHRLVQTPSSRPGTHGFLAKKMLSLSLPEQIESVCRQLRQREALWRADPAVKVL